MFKTESFEMNRESRNVTKEKKKRIEFKTLFSFVSRLFLYFVPRSTCFYTGMGDPETNLVKFEKTSTCLFLALSKLPNSRLGNEPNS